MIGILAILLILWLVFWSLKHDSVNRFIISCIFLVLFLPYELFSAFAPIEQIRKMSPFAFYVIIFSIFNIFKTDFHRYLHLHKSMIAYYLLFIYVIVLTYFNSGGKGWGTIIDNYIAVLLIMNFMAHNKFRLNEIDYSAILKLISVSSIYMVIEFIIRFNVLYSGVFSHAEWVESQWQQGYHRSTGGIGHPLIAATLYLMFLPFIANVKSKYTVLLYALAFMAIVATGSRAGFFLALAYTLYLMQRRNEIGILSVYMLIVFVITGFLFLFGFFDSIIYRTFNSEGSTAVRFAIFDIIEEVFTVGWFGNGIGTTADFIERVSFWNAIEITWISFIIEIGFLGMFGFLIAWLYYFIYNNVANANSVMLVLLFCMVTSYNSLVVHTPIMFLLTIFVFLNAHLHRKNQLK